MQGQKEFLSSCRHDVQRNQNRTQSLELATRFRR